MARDRFGAESVPFERVEPTMLGYAAFKEPIMNLASIAARAAGNAATAITEAAGAVTGAVVGGAFGAIKGAINGAGLGNSYRHTAGNDDRTSTPRTTASPKADATTASLHPAPGGTHRKPTTNNRNDTATIRAWARRNGHSVSTRGRIPTAVRDAYNAAH
jgi:hypothetical protein